MPITIPKVTTLRRSVNTAFLSCAVIGGAALIPVSAHAISASSDTVTTKIDLRDLKTSYGVKRVYAQLSRKAEASCGVRFSTGISARRSAISCAENLLASFVKDVDHKVLTAHHKDMISTV